MPRLIDEIRSQGSLARYQPDRWLPEGEIKRIPWAFQALEHHSLPVFVIDNVAEYFGRFALREYSKLGPEWKLELAFPNAAPPFRRFWMEHRGAGSADILWRERPLVSVPGEVFPYDIPGYQRGVLIT